MARRVGQILKRGNRWLVRTSWFNEHGKRRTRAITVDGSRKDAERELRKLVDQVERVGDVKVELRRQPFGEYMEHWLAERQGLSERTKYLYRHQLKKHVIPALGHIRVGDLRRAHMEQFLRRLSDADLAPNSRRFALRVVLPAIREAVESGALVRDPLIGVRRPGTMQVRHQRTLSAEELEQILDGADTTGDRQLAALVYVLALTGARPNEVLALQWTDIDFATGRTEIRRALAGRIVKTTKTGKTRTVVLPEPALVRLRALRSLEAEQALSRGIERPVWVFASADGRPLLYRGNAAYRLGALLRRCKIPNASPYTFRHSAGSQLLAAGVGPADVAAILGNRPATLLKHYAHHLPGAAERAGVILAKVAGR